MKKKILFLSLFCLTVITGYISYRIMNKPVVEYSTHPLREAWPEDINSLKNESDLVARVRILPEPRNIIKGEGFHQNILSYTETDAVVLEVLSGDASIGDTITIDEPYFIMETLTQIQLHTIFNYYPSVPGQEYIFFLKKFGYESDFAGMYAPIHIEMGRYPILKDIPRKKETVSLEKSNRTLDVYEYTNAELNLGKGDTTEYREFLEEVVEKYQ